MFEYRQSALNITNMIIHTVAKAMKRLRQIGIFY